MKTHCALVAVLPIVFAMSLDGQDAAWQKNNDRGNRYEGSRSVQVAAPVVELIGFHAYRQSFKPGDDLTLNVYFFAGGDAMRARLTAREILREEFYWMEAKPQKWTLGWNRFGPWPVRDVLRRLRIDSSNLAVLVRLDGFPTGGGKIAPVFINGTNDAMKVREYGAFFVPGKALDGVDYRLTSTANGVVLKSGSLGRKLAQTPFTIRLPIGDVPAGPMRLDLSCRVAGEPPPPRHVSYDFHHQPRMSSPR